MFRIGQKVVQIKKSPWRSLHLGELGPSFGDVVTVRSVGPGKCGDLFLRFDEIINPPLYNTDPTDGFREARFLAAHFRPVVERKTDISIFLAMLTPSPVTVDAMKLADHAREIVG